MQSLIIDLILLILTISNSIIYYILLQKYNNLKEAIVHLQEQIINLQLEKDRGKRYAM